MSAVRRIHILGVTGSIGASALQVLLKHSERFDVRVVSAYSSVDLLAERARAVRARVAVICDPLCLGTLEEALKGTGIRASSDLEGELAAERVDVTLAAIMGMAGLAPLMTAIAYSDTVAIANKEPLVAAGPQVLAHAAAHECVILPVDSEHNAVYQVFDAAQRQAIERVVLTASGGPFRLASRDVMRDATPAQALRHPNWEMGKKISIDSATLMNKALEVIEAAVLFDLAPDEISVLLHPQSVVHGMVEYSDGSVLAQMGASDMCTPLSTVLLGQGERLSTPGARLDFHAFASLEFSSPDIEAFPALGLAYEGLALGQYACVALNAANEEAVRLFLEGAIGFLDIAAINADVMRGAPAVELSTLGDILAYDKARRAEAILYSGKSDFKNAG